jgi:Flp pilus assembly protein CpaB
MTKPTLVVALAAALCGSIAAPVLAQNAEPAPAAAAPAKPKLKTPPGAPTVTVLVTNARKADLVQLQAAESGSANWKKVLGAVKAGKQASAILPRSFNCRFDLHGTFADGQSMDASDVDVCAQKTLNLTD